MDATAICGRKTDAIFLRYGITSVEDKRVALERLAVCRTSMRITPSPDGYAVSKRLLSDEPYFPSTSASSLPNKSSSTMVFRP